MKEKPTRCIDPILKSCEDCPYGWVRYPDWVETYEDIHFCTFESGCIYGFENDEPTAQELKDFNDFCEKMQEL